MPSYSNIPQRNCRLDEIGTLQCRDAIVIWNSVTFPAGGENSALAVKLAAEDLTRKILAEVAKAPNKRLVWRILPEAEVTPIKRFFGPDGTETNPAFSPIPVAREEETDQMIARGYARFWFEEIDDEQ